jgi:hypothetical protein
MVNPAGLLICGYCCTEAAMYFHLPSTFMRFTILTLIGFFLSRILLEFFWLGGSRTTGGLPASKFVGDLCLVIS